MATEWAKESKKGDYIDIEKRVRVTDDVGLPLVREETTIFDLTAAKKGQVETHGPSKAFYKRAFFKGKLERDKDLNKGVKKYMEWATEKRPPGGPAAYRARRTDWLKAGEDFIDKDVLYFLGEGYDQFKSGQGGGNFFDIMSKEYPELFKKYHAKVNLSRGTWEKTLKEVADIAGRDFNEVLNSIRKENQAVKKLLGIDKLPSDMVFGYSGDHLGGLKTAIINGRPDFANKVLDNVIASTRGRNTELGWKLLEKPKNRLVREFKNAKTLDAKSKIITRLNDLVQKVDPGSVEWKINKGKLDFKPLIKQTTLEQKASGYLSHEGVTKFLKKMGYGKHCKASGGRVGFAEAGAVTGEMKCIMGDVEKTRADMKSSNVEVRAKALTKQRKALQLASKLPGIGKILKTGIQMGTAAITKPLKALGLTAPIGYAIEGIVEGGFYDNARRKGYSHKQAMAETFTPGLAAGRPEGVPWYGGAEKLREQELVGDPKQNPKVAQYVDALKEQDRIYDVIGRKEELKNQPTTTDETLFIPGDLAAASADVQDLARSGAYRRVDRTLKPESMASQAYETAVEQQLGKDLQRKKEYLEEYDPGALEREEKILSRPRQLEKRYNAMEERFPTYTREQLDEMLEAWGANTPWNLGFESGVKGYEQMAEWLKTHDKYKDMEAGVANRATGGIASLKK